MSRGTAIERELEVRLERNQILIAQSEEIHNLLVQEHLLRIQERKLAVKEQEIKLKIVEEQLKREKMLTEEVENRLNS